jgi:hypothetical protein
MDIEDPATLLFLLNSFKEREKATDEWLESIKENSQTDPGTLFEARKQKNMLRSIRIQIEDRYRKLEEKKKQETQG